jgi:hypothetical protein
MIQSLGQLPMIVSLLTFSAATTSESVLEILLRVTGLTASPAPMRGPGDEVDAGDIWVVSPGGAPPTALTSGGGYRSPIFSPVDGSIVALRRDTVVRIPAHRGSIVPIRDVPGVLKLVGFEAKNGDDVVVLLDGGGSSLGVLSLNTGRVVPLSYDAKSDDERRMLEQIRGQERVYGNVSVYVKTESKKGLSRTIEWTDVYLQRGDSQPQNVSVCDGVRCGQPALSPDGHQVAFIKSRS